MYCAGAKLNSDCVFVCGSALVWGILGCIVLKLGVWLSSLLEALFFI